MFSWARDEVLMWDQNYQTSLERSRIWFGKGCSWEHSSKKFLNIKLSWWVGGGWGVVTKKSRGISKIHDLVHVFFLMVFQGVHKAQTSRHRDHRDETPCPAVESFWLHRKGCIPFCEDLGTMSSVKNQSWRFRIIFHDRHLKASQQYQEPRTPSRVLCFRRAGIFNLEGKPSKTSEDSWVVVSKTFHFFPKLFGCHNPSLTCTYFSIGWLNHPTSSLFHVIQKESNRCNSNISRSSQPYLIIKKNLGWFLDDFLGPQPLLIPLPYKMLGVRNPSWWLPWCSWLPGKPGGEGWLEVDEDTPWKFNIAPENKPFQKEWSLPTIIFQGRTVKLRGCKWCI